MCEKIEESHGLTKKSKVFKKFYGILPSYENHNAALDGLLSISFYGNFILLLTNEMTLKMISLDQSMQESYLGIFKEKLDIAVGTSEVSMQVVEDLSLILVLAANKIYYFKYNEFGITSTKILTLKGLTTISYFHVSREGILFASGFNSTLPYIFI